MFYIKSHVKFQIRFCQRRSYKLKNSVPSKTDINVASHIKIEINSQAVILITDINILKM